MLHYCENHKSKVLVGMDVDSSTEDSSKIKVENCSNDLRSTYSFESDSLALKENTDYQQLLRTICVLEAQRSQALEDIDMLLENIHAVQQDPEGFVEKLQCGKLPRLPEPQQVAELPHIEWERYTGNLELNLVRSRQSVRLKKQNIEVKSISQLKSHLITGTEGYVRGRLKDKDKCPTFNQLWTEEEQCRLDELLRKYPPEEVEAQRWKKIAADLGNRTPAQVASRVQKYFYKLEKNHLPIPGRVPNRASSAMRHRRMRRRRGGIFGSTSSWQSSTFLRSYRPLVNIDSADNPGIGTYTGFNAKYPTEVAPPVHTKVTDLDDMAMLKDCQEMKDLQELLNQRKAKISSLDPSVQVHCHFQSRFDRNNVPQFQSQNPQGESGVGASHSRQRLYDI